MKINNVEYLCDYKLLIKFSDNKIKIVDLEELIKGSKGIFLPLRNIDYFKKVTLDDCQLSICWPNGADICPDVLYELGKEVRPRRKGISRRSKVIPSVLKR